MNALDIDRALKAALLYHQQGGLGEAATLYVAILAQQPGNVDALHLLGVLKHQTGDHAGGLALIREAAARDPRRPEIQGNLGRVLHTMGKGAEAEAAYRAALDIDPGFVDALTNLGALQLETGRIEEAIGTLKRAVDRDADHGNATMNLGNSLRANGDVRAAEAAHRRAVRLMPGSERAWMNLATTLMDLERLGEAGEALRRSMALAPNLVEAINNFAFLQINTPDFAAAEAWFRRAVALEPAYAAPRSGLAEVAYFRGEIEAALRHSEAAVRLSPADPQIRVRHSMRLLAAGRLGEGWDEREWRLEAKDRVRRLGLPPRWKGESLAGRRILVCAEEGVGDEILYASLVPDLIARGAAVVLECDERLVPVFRRAFPEALVHAYARAGNRFKPVQRYDWLPTEPAVDFAIDGGSLPRYLRRDITDFERARPYLAPDPARLAHWRERLAALGPGPKIGFAWRSKHVSAFRNIHYTTLSDWRPLLTDPDLTLVSLQYGTGWRDEIREAERASGGRVAVLSGADLTDDFDDILAVAAAVDLMVCPSSTLGWIGGGLGRPTWIFHPRPLFVQFGTDRFPGFPSVRSFAKPVEAPWSDVVEAVHRACRAEFVRA